MHQHSVLSAGRASYQGAAPNPYFRPRQCPVGITGATGESWIKKEEPSGGGAHRAWNEWVNEYEVLEKKLGKSYDPMFRGLHGNVARKG